MISLKSEITKKILNYFFINPDESLYTNEIARNLNVDKRNLVKKLKEMEKNGLLKSSARGNLKFYSLNTQYSLLNEYKKIVLSTIGIEAKIKDALKGVNSVDCAFIYGSYASDNMDTNSDIDVLAVGSHSVIKLQNEIIKIQKETNREINVVNIDKNDFEKRKKNKDPFIQKILKSRHIKIDL